MLDMKRRAFITVFGSALCRTPDQSHAEDEHADRQQRCADIGEIDQRVRGPGIGQQHGEEESCRDQDGSDGD